jgi:glycosyltransferase involved in cell wall biosynthesis
MDLQPNQQPTVGFIVSVWPRLSETFILNEVVALERLGSRLRIFSVKTNPKKDEPVHAKVAQVRAPVTCLKVGGQRKAVWRANLRLLCKRPIRYFRTLLQAISYRRRVIVKRFFQAGYLAEILAGEPVTHLHAHFAHDPTMVAMFTHRLTGIPYSFTAHAKDIYLKTTPEVLRAEAQQAQAVVTCTEYNRKYLADEVGLTPKGKVHCIYHGLDLSQFKFQWPRVPQTGAPLILSVARLVEKKGLNDLLCAADLLRRRGRSFQIEIIGDGPLRQALKAQAEQLGLNGQLRLLGDVSHDSVCRAYQRASVFALPCIVAADGDRDGIPNVLAEAMASGLPVVATPVSGIPELIESEQQGLLVPPSNPLQLADALERLLTQPELCGRLARAARDKVETCFSLEGASTRLLALFQRNGR